ncbi:IclR family transcriptional regulator [Skermanella pratensis]|uniref:IclR family transcriptional regulator n=1 Tax=Skermanella pratensis TaxID=2233999 RepID=UPI0013018F59|nr:IclR family transcriptional regulator [Skermanella pratensis]
MSDAQIQFERGAGYSAPALEKGLDILELLAGECEPLSQSNIASRLDRSIGEIFRMLVALERRGYVRRYGADGGYVLTLKLFDLSTRHPALERLLSAARADMRVLAEQTGQSCHLSVWDLDRIMIVAKDEGSTARTFSVKAGATFSAIETASGRVLMAFQSPGERAARIECALAHTGETKAAAELERRLDGIGRNGYEESGSDAVMGVVDLSCPILSHSRTALAALTIPFLHMKGNKVSQVEAVGALKTCAERISTRLGSAG